MLKLTVVTHGRIGLEAERAALARAGSLGGQVLAIEHVAERLAGGFLRIVDLVSLRETVSEILPDTDLGELDAIKSQPGMVSACADSLMAYWMSGLSRAAYERNVRMSGIFALEDAVLARLASHRPHLRKPSDIVSLAVARARIAPKVLGRLVIKGMTDLHPVWRPILHAAAAIEGYGFTWDNGPMEKPEWLSSFPKGSVETVSSPASSPVLSAVVCADARHEIVEALRWAFGLMSEGVKGEDIAIVTASVGAYDSLMHTVSRTADVRIHMAQGIPALQTPEGQECAALADILIRGLSHKRLRRLFEVVGPSTAFGVLPSGWEMRIPQDAALLTVERWEKMLRRRDMGDVRELLLPLVELLAGGIEKAVEAADVFLTDYARILWKRALQNGPASALDQTLRGMRVRNSEGSSLDRVCFMSTQDLVAAPRAHVRFLGLTSRGYPRAPVEDGLIPGYIVPGHLLSPMSIAELDRRDFGSILSTTAKEIVFSWPRMDGEGRELRPSTLVPADTVKTATVVGRTRRTLYAYSERDRLFMRSLEFSALPAAKRAKTASTNWRRPSLTPHDGLIRAAHPRIEAVFAQVQSATSLQKMIRDPQGFVWKYALGFHAPEYEDEPLLVDNRVFGNIVHGILKIAVQKLNRKGGFATASHDVIKSEVFKARGDQAVVMERTQPIPPPMIWAQTLDRAEKAAYQALTFDYGVLPGQVSHAEIPFGSGREWLPEELPWALDKDVFIPGTNVRVRGVIDRLDLSGDAAVARVTDYKNGKTPAKPQEIGIAGGRELQRGIYRSAVETLLEGQTEVVSALYYPLTDTYIPMEDGAANMALVTNAVLVAQEVLRAGNSLPGIAAAEEFNDMLFAHPARATTVYLKYKQPLIGGEFEELRKVWDTK